MEAFRLTDGISVVRTSETGRSDSGDDTTVLGRLQRALNTHTLKIDLKGSDVVSAVSSAGRALGEVADTVLGDDVTEEAARGKGEQHPS